MDQLLANEPVVISPDVKLTVTPPGPADDILIPLKSVEDLLYAYTNAVFVPGSPTAPNEANNLIADHSLWGIISVVAPAAPIAVACVTHKYWFEELTPGLVVDQPFAVVKLTLPLENVTVVFPSGNPLFEPTPVGALELLFCLYKNIVELFVPSTPSCPCANTTAVDHSLAAIVSVEPLPAAVAAQTYKGSVPVGIVLDQPFAKLPVVIVPEVVPVKETVTAPGLLVSALADLWYAYTMAFACPAGPVTELPSVPAFAFDIV